MSIHCANCGRVVPKYHPSDGALHFCDFVCLSLYEGQALEDELTDLESEWSADDDAA